MPVAAADINAPPLGVDKEIVCVTARVDGCDGGSIFYRQLSNLRGISRRYQHSSRIFVERHRKIAAALNCPTRALFAAESIDDRDPMRLRQVHEDAAVRSGKLKALRVG